MFEDTTLTVVLSIMIGLMVPAFIGLRMLNKDNRRMEEEIKAFDAGKTKTAHKS